MLYQIPLLGQGLELANQTLDKMQVSALREELKNLKGPFKSRRAKEIKEKIKTGSLKD